MSITIDTMCAKYLLLLTFLWYGSARDFEYEGCHVESANSTYCSLIELRVDEPIMMNKSISKEVYIRSAKGSIGAKTLSPFEEAESLWFYGSEIDFIEDGAICSLPRLKEFVSTHGRLPNLTRGTLRGCDKLQTLNIGILPEQDAFQELTGLEVLEIGVTDPTSSKFNRAYLEPLKNLKLLHLVVSDLDEMENGLYCTPPVLEDLQLYVRNSWEIRESSFDGCSRSLKKILISGSKFAEGESPFRNFPYLEEIKLSDTNIAHLTNEFLSGLPNLRTFQLYSNGKVKIDDDTFANVPHLTSLAMSRCKLHEEDLKALHPLVDLVVLDLSSNSIKNPEALPNLPSLEHLVLRFNSIEKFNLENLKKKLPNLKKLVLKFNPLLPEFEEEIKREETIRITYGRRVIDV